MPSIRARLVSAQAIFSALIAVILAATIAYSLRPGLLAIEQQAGKDLAARFHLSLKADIEGVRRLAVDWATWDAAYTFVKKRNKGFITENFSDATFTTTGLDLIALVDTRGNVAHAETYNSEREQRLSKRTLDLQTPADEPPFWAVKTLRDGQSGLWWYKGKIYIFATAPITNSRATKAPRGIVLMAMELDQDLLSSLSARVQTNVYLTPPDALRRISPAADPLITRTSDDMATVTTNLLDYHGLPIMTATLALPRDLYQIGWDAATNTAWIAFGATVLMTLLLAIMTYRLVSAPLRDLSRKVYYIAEDQDKQTVSALPTHRKDEIGVVARAVQRMYVRTIFLANHDPLTDLPNETLFQKALYKATDAQHNRHDDGKGLLLIALDGFKDVNELYGPQEGDRILESFSHRLRATLREEDFLARTGGVSFSIICGSIHSADDLTALAEKIIALSNEGIPLSDGKPVTLNLNIGGSLLHVGAPDHMTLTAAKNALMKAQRNGKNTYTGSD